MIAFLAFLLAAQPAAHDQRERTALLDFHYRWPAAAEAVPALRAELRRRMAAAHAEALEGARQSRDSARGARVPFYREQYDEAWSVEAENGHYLSLTADLHTDQNGAHPNRDFEALLWDRAAGRAVNAATLLGPHVLARLEPHYCAMLATQIRARTGGGPPEQCGWASGS